MHRTSDASIWRGHACWFDFLTTKRPCRLAISSHACWFDFLKTKRALQIGSAFKMAHYYSKLQNFIWLGDICVSKASFSSSSVSYQLLKADMRVASAQVTLHYPGAFQTNVIYANSVVLLELVSSVSISILLRQATGGNECAAVHLKRPKRRIQLREEL